MIKKVLQRTAFETFWRTAEFGTKPVFWTIRIKESQCNCSKTLTLQDTIITQIYVSQILFSCCAGCWFQDHHGWKSSAGGTVAAGKLNYFLVGFRTNAVRRVTKELRRPLKHRFGFPRLKLVVNLAPAVCARKDRLYDLPIALAILAATRQIDESKLKDYLILGELSLDGSLRPVRGVLPIAIQARKEVQRHHCSIRQRTWSCNRSTDRCGSELINSRMPWFHSRRKEIAPVRFDTWLWKSLISYANDPAFWCRMSEARKKNIKRALEIAAAAAIM